MLVAAFSLVRRQEALIPGKTQLKSTAGFKQQILAARRQTKDQLLR
jgi:hypothetical protein